MVGLAKGLNFKGKAKAVKKEKAPAPATTTATTPMPAPVSVVVEEVAAMVKSVTMCLPIPPGVASAPLSVFTPAHAPEKDSGNDSSDDDDSIDLT